MRAIEFLIFKYWIWMARRFTSLLMSAETMTMTEAIKSRHSVRTFKGPLEPSRRAIVDSIIEEVQKIEVPFHTSAEVADAPAGLGKHGVIKNEAGWLLAKIPADAANDARYLYDAAYRMHTFVLRMTQHNFACVWVGGTYDRNAAEAIVPGFSVPCTVAYGEDGQSVRVVERVMKWFAGSKDRKPLQKLFYDGDNHRPFTEENNGDWLGVLRAVQSCPSAKNNQPWRLFITGNVVTVFYNAKKAACHFDIGIALATMKLYLEASGKKLAYTTVDTPPESPLGGAYVVTCTIN